MRSLFLAIAIAASTAALVAAASSTMMPVSITVARSCTVGGQTRTSVTLACSRGVHVVSVTTAGPFDSIFAIASSTTRPPLDIRSLIPGQNAVGVLEPQPVDPETDRGFVVTLNF